MAQGPHHSPATELIAAALESEPQRFCEVVADVLISGRVIATVDELPQTDSEPIGIRLLRADAGARNGAVPFYELARLSQDVEEWEAAFAADDVTPFRLWLDSIRAESGLWQGEFSALLHTTEPAGTEPECRLAELCRARLDRATALVAVSIDELTPGAERSASRAIDEFRRLGCHDEEHLTHTLLAYAEMSNRDDPSLHLRERLDRGVDGLERLSADRLPHALACLVWSSYMMGDLASAATAIDRFDESTTEIDQLPPLVTSGVDAVRGMAHMLLEGPNPETIDQIKASCGQLQGAMPAWFGGQLAHYALDVGAAELADELLRRASGQSGFSAAADLTIRCAQARLRILKLGDRSALDQIWDVFATWEALGKKRRAGAAAIRCSWTAHQAGFEADAGRLRTWGETVLAAEESLTAWERGWITGAFGTMGAVQSRGELRVLAPDVTVHRDDTVVKLGDLQAKLLALLAAERRPVTTDWIICALWPDADLPAGKNRLGALLHRLRQRLDLMPDELIRRTRLGIELDGHGWTIDAWDFWDLSHGDADAQRRALELYRSDLAARQLAYDDAVTAVRDQLPAPMARGRPPAGIHRSHQRRRDGNAGLLGWHPARFTGGLTPKSPRERTERPKKESGPGVA